MIQEEFEKREKIGIEKGRRMLIRNMLAKGLTAEDIALYTGLSVDEVRRIAGKAE